MEQEKAEAVAAAERARKEVLEACDQTRSRSARLLGRALVVSGPFQICQSI